MADTGESTTFQDMTVVVQDLKYGGTDGSLISETEFGYVDGITPGTIAASKAVVVDANKDVGSFRDITLREIDASAAAALNIGKATATSVVLGASDADTTVSGDLVVSGGDADLGASGTAGTLDIFPGTASKGKWILSMTDQDGDTNVTLKPAAMGQASVVSIPDPGAATANVLLTSAANDGAVVGATSVEIDAMCDQGSRIKSLTDGDASLAVADSGKIHLVANVSADRTFTLPAVASGLDFYLQSTVSAADGHDWIILTDANDNTEFFLGGVYFQDSAGTTYNVVASDGDSNDTMQINLPDAGTWVRFTSDGTNWVVSGSVHAAAAPTFAD